jgi:hypothetical protein
MGQYRAEAGATLVTFIVPVEHDLGAAPVPEKATAWWLAQLSAATRLQCRAGGNGMTMAVVTHEMGCARKVANRWCSLIKAVLSRTPIRLPFSARRGASFC